ncbi:nucleoside 2-deoxyribosyltransferase [Loigolactobacillus zhaoyuanensis]|uniref:Nucleoside 2-deoxyribosyltransferase n=1 Tax=Loigolactobacillus zhaoyuanensis TaxID=2486017 RepID=A0ABW8UGL0_9LACO|nr:nucleoside 2-deoxyribosyltransferase [Loigolactobacillus zhaoyuanensis]
MAANIYLAAPFFNDEQIQRLQQVEKALIENTSIDNVFVPMNDTNAAGLEFGTPQWRDLAYHEDLAGLTNADVVVAVYDYEAGYSDPGTMFEIGYAVANQIPVVVYYQQHQSVNLMIAQGLHYYCHQLAELSVLNFMQLPEKPFTGEVF